MKNILVLTSVYPADDYSKTTTPVVHYFAKEWVSMNYNVLVIHNQKYHPRIINFFLHLFRNTISNYYNFTFSTRETSLFRHYIHEGVTVYRFPIFKIFPKVQYSKKQKSLQLKKIINLLNSIEFIPDIILGHWANPQLQQVYELSKLYQTPTSMVMHSDIDSIYKLYKKRSRSIINSINIWGFRSLAIKNRFENLYGPVPHHFHCFSGIPIPSSTPPPRTFENGLTNFLFVGSLIKRKAPSILIKAITKSLPHKNFHITYIGTGKEKKHLEKLIKKFKISDKVTISGRLPRHDIFEAMKKSDCFIMVSQPETFGLVYLEAMSMGCITIGSQGEGIDGIITHGVNGYLSEAHNEKKLTNLLTKINSLSSDELSHISLQAIKTATQYSEKKAALHYIESLKQHIPHTL